MDNNTINDIAEKLQDIKRDREELNEASEISQSDIQASDMKRIKTLEKLFNASLEGFHEGGHGSIIDMNSKNLGIQFQNSSIRLVSNK